MAKLLTLKPSNLKASDDLSPSFLFSSVLARPFALLARISSDTLLTCLDQSVLTQTISGTYGTISQAIARPFEKADSLKAALEKLHVLSFFALFVAAAFASTGQIALVAAGSFFLLVLRRLIDPVRLKPTIIDTLVSIFFLTAVVSALFSSYVHTSLIGLAKFMIFFAGYLNFRSILGEKPGRLTWIFGLLVLLGLSESLIGFYQYIHHVQPLATWQDTSVNPEDQLTRIFGTLKPSNPNLLAGFLIPCLASGLSLFFVNLAKRRWLWSAFSILASIPMLLALVLTGSRGGYLSIVAMGTVSFLILGHLLWHEETLKEKYKLKALWLITLIGSVLAIGAGFAIVPAIRNRFLSIFAARQDSSNSYRMNVWISTIQMIKDNWLFGIGPGNNTFKQVYGLYMVPGYNALSAYSIFLEIWAEQGIMGIVAFFLLLKTTCLRTWLSFYTRIPLEYKLWLGFLLVGIIGSVVYGLFDTIWYRPSVNFIFWLFVAGFAVYSEMAIGNTWKDASRN